MSLQIRIVHSVISLLIPKACYDDTMRRIIANRAQSAAIAIRNEVTTSPLASRTTYVCANCRRAALQFSKKPSSPRRAFSSSASRYAAPHAARAAATQEHHAGPIPPQTHYDFFPSTFPHGPPPDSPFSPDLRQLRKEFLQLQAKAHPDLAPHHQKRQAEALSSRINEAYKALQDPLKRAQYLLSLRGIDVEDDSAKLSESALLMEVMEAREAVEEAESEADVAALRDENDVRIQASVESLDEAFAQSDMDRAEREAVRLRYWMNIAESIHGWEEGKGGGMIHH